ncbi:MAG TPA: hypothetical protein VJ732_11065 [Bryobacteraceae bacterium]|nr:hypothetical protein [Bryobacteraceae bacterium]
MPVASVPRDVLGGITSRLRARAVEANRFETEALLLAARERARMRRIAALEAVGSTIAALKEEIRMRRANAPRPRLMVVASGGASSPKPGAAASRPVENAA